jgi:hypothetical protein
MYVPRKRKSGAISLRHVPEGVFQEPPVKKKLSRRVQYNKKKRLKWEREHKASHQLEDVLPITNLRTELDMQSIESPADIVFDPTKVYLFFIFEKRGLIYLV